MEARFCEHCGAELPRAEAPEPATSSARFGDVAARFAALEAHPHTLQLMEHTLAVRGLGSGVWGSVLALILLGGAGLAVTIVFFGVCPPLGFLPLAIVVIGGFALVRQIITSARISRAPVERLKVLVIDERTKINGGGEHQTICLATLEFPDGTRREFEAFDDVAGKITAGDIGVAFVKANYLVDFGRVPV